LENDLKIVYCCRTHTQNSRVIAELNAIGEHLNQTEGDSKELLGQIGGISLRGRGEMCFKTQITKTGLSPGDASVVCSQLRKDKKCVFFNNFQKLLEKSNQLGIPGDTLAFDADQIMAWCSEKKICPYFFAKELMASVRVIAANYNWIFNPTIQDKFLDSIGKSIEDILLIIDEAHNLPSLAEEINSLKLGRYTVMAAKKELVDYFGYTPELRKIEAFLAAVEELFTTFEKRIGMQEEIEIDARNIIESLSAVVDGNLKGFLTFMSEKGEEIQKKKVEAGRKTPRSFVHAVAQFWSSWYFSTVDKAAYYHVFSQDSNKTSANYFLEAVCLDPGLVGIKDVIENVYATISMSGTILPEAYTAICRIPSPSTFKLDSPFSIDQVKSLVLEGVSTEQGARNPSMYAKYLRKIVEMASGTPKNSAAFCASYTVLKGILDAGFEKAMRQLGKIPVCEKLGMTSAENDDLITNYKNSCRTSNGACLLGVCGGRNSEGQDFPGDEMNAVMICGVPYATPTPRVKKKIEYYDTMFEGKGWMLGYLIPAVQKANQACGRPIRTMTDTAAVILADERFKQERILKLLSPWVLRNISSLKDVQGALEATLSNFYAKKMH
jgi:DNA excision repair protein ERCC-2